MKRPESRSVLKKSITAETSWTRYIWITVFVIGILMLYRQVGKFDMINWDEKRYLLETPFVKKINAESIQQMFSDKVLASYNPLVLLSFAIDYQLAKEDWGWYHNVNVFIHFLNTLLLFYLMRKLKMKTDLAGMVTALFAFHPLAVEAVGWIAGRKDMLYTFFYFSSAIFYLKYREQKKVLLYVFSVFLALLSGLSKVQAITIPAFLLVADYVVQRKINLKNLVNKIPYFIISAVFGLINITGTTLVADKYSTPPTITDKIMYSVMAFGMYVEKLIFPSGLSVIHNFPEKNSANYFLAFTVGLVIMMLMVYLIIRGFKRAPWVTGGLLLYASHIFPVLHLVGYNSAIIYERFTYVAGIGIFIAVIRADEFLPKWEQVRSKIMIPALAVFLVVSFQRISVWQNPVTLWTDAIEKNPKAEQAYNNRGQYYDSKGEAEKSLADFNASIALRPNKPDAWNNRCVYYFRKKEWAKAMEANDKVLEIEPNSTDGLSNRAGIYFNQAKYDSAIYFYRKLTEVSPSYASAYYNMGAAYFKMKNYRASADEFLRAYSYASDYAGDLSFLALAYIRLEIPDSALYYAKLADQINPATGAIRQASQEYIAWGNEAYAMGTKEKSLEYYTHATKVDPYNAEAYYNMGGLYLLRNEIAKARECWLQTIRINPAHKEAAEWLEKTK